MKYDLADCKITEGENALSILADKRQTREKWMDGMMSEGDRVLVMKITFWSFWPDVSLMIVTYSSWHLPVNRAIKSSFQESTYSMVSFHSAVDCEFNPEV